MITKITKAGIRVENFFGDYIGQTHIIGELNEVLTMEKREIPIPFRPAAFEGSAGLGKTNLAKLIAAARERIAETKGQKHHFVSIPSNASRPQVIKMLAEHVNDKVATIFCDECHDHDKRLRNMLKPILETGGKIETVRLSEEAFFEANPFKHFWIFASNEDLAAKDPALFGPTGRTTSHIFQPYTDSEKEALLRLALSEGDEVRIDKDAVEYLCERVWPNAREITQELAPELRRKAMLAGGKISLAFAKAYCAGEMHHVSASLRGTVARYPLGLVWTDIQALQYMASDTRGKLVTEIGNACGGMPMKTASYRLQWLSSLGLIATTVNGRKGLSQKGSDYLRALVEAQKKARAAKAKAAAPKAETKPATK